MYDLYTCAHMYTCMLMDIKTGTYTPNTHREVIPVNEELKESLNSRVP